jgi:hypothetical protein
LLIHAKFLPAHGISHDGLVIYDPDLDEVFAIDLLLGDSHVILNRHLRDLSNLELEQYEALTEEHPGGVLPIQYHIMAESLKIGPGIFML